MTQCLLIIKYIAFYMIRLALYVPYMPDMIIKNVICDSLDLGAEPAQVTD